MRAFFIECSAPFWTTVTGELERELGVRPVYWTGLAHYGPELKARHPDLVYHDCIEAKYGIPAPEATALPKACFDEAMAEIWRCEAQVVYDMLNRFDLNRDFRFLQRRRYFHRVLLYWASVIDRYEPELVVFPNPPHVGYDYLLYCLCRRRRIRTVMFDETAIATPYKYNLTMTDFGEGDPHLRRTYREKLDGDSGGDVALSPAVVDYLATLTAGYELAKPVVEKQVALELAARSTQEFSDNDQKFLSLAFADDYGGSTGFEPPSRGWLADRWDRLVLALQEQKPETRKKRRRDWLTSCWKQMGVRFEDSFDSTPFAATEFELNSRWYWGQADRRRAFYESLAGPFDASVPYVYVSFAGQPERTSNPQGGIFADQALLVQVLSDAVPDGWRIYVKEHPNHFNPSFHGHTCRSPEFYQDVARFPNVSFVPIASVPFELIDRARAVATIAGTSGWEAVNRGVPALIFGAAWYRDCEGVFFTPDHRSCAEALRAIEAGRGVDRRKVLLFAQAVEESAWEGLADPLPESWTGLSNEENGRRLARAVVRILGDSPDAARRARG